MKKTLVFIVSLFLLTGLAGCNVPAPDGNNKTNGNTVTDVESISDDWKDLEFILGVDKYSFPLFYQSLNSKGWQLEENDELPAGEFTFESQEMWNNAFYDEKQDLYVCIYACFHNNEDVTKKIKDCNIWLLAFYKIDSDSEFKNQYEIKLAKGIKWGSTEEEILAAYGPVEEGYRIDGGGTGCILVYFSLDENMMTQMNLHINYDSGLYLVELAYYPVEEG
ncbi:MAG TPA: hypothetical protein PLI19_06850 [Erysipelotrichaceae bacterium]|nr:hypothetical protein [Erysipelotrichaceae bacterium]